MIILNRKRFIVYVLCIITLILITLGSYVYISQQKEASVINQVKKTEVINMLGKYNAEYGVGEITISSSGNSKIKVVGKTILAGPGNSSDKETVDARTGKINGGLLMNGNRGVYKDINPECSLDFEFKSNGAISVGGGSDCDITIQNFVGNYQK